MQVTFVGTVKSNSASSVKLKLNNQPVDLSANGGTWTGQQTIDVGQNLDIQFEARGLNGTDWDLDVSAKCAKKNISVFSKNGTVGGSGKDELEETVGIAADPCAKK